MIKWLQTFLFQMLTVIFLVVVAGLVHSPYGFQIKPPSFLIQKSLLHVYNYIIDFTGNHAINPECNMKMRRYKLLWDYLIDTIPLTENKKAEHSRGKTVSVPFNFCFKDACFWMLFLGCIKNGIVFIGLAILILIW